MLPWVPLKASSNLCKNENSGERGADVVTNFSLPMFKLGIIRPNYLPYKNDSTMKVLSFVEREKKYVNILSPKKKQPNSCGGEKTKKVKYFFRKHDRHKIFTFVTIYFFVHKMEKLLMIKFYFIRWWHVLVRKNNDLYIREWAPSRD